MQLEMKMFMEASLLKWYSDCLFSYLSVIILFSIPSANVCNASSKLPNEYFVIVVKKCVLQEGMEEFQLQMSQLFNSIRIKTVAKSRKQIHAT